MRRIKCLSFIFLIFCSAAFGQTGEFTYQGRLVDGSLAASGTYEMRFRLFDAETDGTQQPQPTPITLDFTVAGSNPVTVTNGVFTVKLDFTAIAFPGAVRFLEISVRRTASDPFTLLNPRQPITSAPHNIRSLTSGSSDGLSVACVLCVTDAQILSLDGSKVTGTVANATTAANVSGIVPIANGGTGSSTQNFVDLSTNQSGIVGNKTFEGTITGNVFSAATQFSIGNNRVLSNPGTDNLFAGVGAGTSNTSGERNAFFGAGAGQANTDGSFNAFFGSNAGLANNSGSLNAFFGTNAGNANISGGDNAFFGTNAGANTTGSRNSFFGRSSGQVNTAGSDNVFIGMFAGNANATGGNNTIIGTSADVASSNLSFASAIGAGALVGTNNTVVLGRPADTVQIPGNLNVSGSITPSLIPAGAVMFFHLAACPSGWSELVEARGRYLVGLPSGGTLGATQGTALSNLEDRPTGQHGHSINPFSHSHTTHGHFANVTVQLGSTRDVAGAVGGIANTSSTSLSISNSGNVAGTNAPYLQLLVCKKD